MLTLPWGPKLFWPSAGLHLDTNVVLANLLDHLRLRQARLRLFVGAGPDLTTSHDLNLGSRGREYLDHAVDVDDLETPTLGQGVCARPLISGFSAGDVDRQTVFANLDVARDPDGDQADDNEEQSEELHASQYVRAVRMVRAVRRRS